jgi:hypothetical protein
MGRGLETILDLATNRDSQRRLFTEFHFHRGKTSSLYLKNIRLIANKYTSARQRYFRACIRGVSLLDSTVYRRSHSLRIART